jgi:hypothetical protein
MFSNKFTLKAMLSFVIYMFICFKEMVFHYVVVYKVGYVDVQSVEEIF